MNERQHSRNVFAAAISAGLVAILAAEAAAYAQGLQLAAQATSPAGFASAYPQRAPADPAVVAQGKAAYGVRCAFCHGSDARGGESGPNLLRSELVLTDRQGENIVPVVQQGRPAQGMPPFDLPVAQIQDIVTFLHSLPVSSHDRSATITIPLGDAAAGKRQFDSKCGSCHSVASLQGIAARVPDPRTLQQTWLLPGGRGGAPDLHIPPKRVTLTDASGKTISGDLNRIDDFLVTLTTDRGESITVERHGETPDVKLEDPLAGHTKLLPALTDANIHDITAYLETLK